MKLTYMCLYISDLPCLISPEARDKSKKVDIIFLGACNKALFGSHVIRMLFWLILRVHTCVHNVCTCVVVYFRAVCTV